MNVIEEFMEFIEKNNCGYGTSFNIKCGKMESYGAINSTIVYIEDDEFVLNDDSINITISGDYKIEKINNGYKIYTDDIEINLMSL